MDINYDRQNHCFSVVSEALQRCSGLIFSCLVDPYRRRQNATNHLPDNTVLHLTTPEFHIMNIKFSRIPIQFLCKINSTKCGFTRTTRLSAWGGFIQLFHFLCVKFSKCNSFLHIVNYITPTFKTLKLKSRLSDEWIKISKMSVNDLQESPASVWCEHISELLVGNQLHSWLQW